MPGPVDQGEGGGRQAPTSARCSARFALRQGAYLTEVNEQGFRIGRRDQGRVVRGWVDSSRRRGAPDPFREGIPWPDPGPDGATAWGEEAAMKVMYARARAACQHACRPVAADGYAAERVSTRRPARQPDRAHLRRRGRVLPAGIRAVHGARPVGVEPIEIPGGHFPMAEDPDSLAELLDRVGSG